MRYIIDGYNFLFSTQETKGSLEMQRTTLIENLHDFALHTKATVEIVFDSSYEHGRYLPRFMTSEEVEVVFAPCDITADEYIVECIERDSARHTYHVFTNDKQLRRLVTLKGSTASTIATVIKLIAKAARAQYTSYETEKHHDALPSITKRELQYWTQVFEAKCTVKEDSREKF